MTGKPERIKMGLFRRSKKVKEATATELSEAPKAFRASSDVQAEYANVCVQIGDKEVKINFLRSEINMLQARCRELNEEATKLARQQQAEAAKAGEANGTPDSTK